MVPSPSRTTPFAGMADGRRRSLHANDEIRQHPGQKLVMRIGDFGTDRHAVSGGIGGRVNFRDRAFEHAVRICRHLSFDGLPQSNARDVRLDNARQHPFFRNVRHGIRRRPAPRLRKESGLRVPRRDLSGNRAAYDQGRIDLPRRDHLVDFAIGFAEYQDCVPRGFERAFGGLLVGGGLFQFSHGNSIGPAESFCPRQFLAGQIERRRGANQGRFGLNEIGTFDRIKRLALLDVVSNLREGIDDGALVRGKDLHRQIFVEIDAAHGVVLHRKQIRSHRLDFDRLQLARR